MTSLVAVGGQSQGSAGIRMQRMMRQMRKRVVATASSDGMRRGGWVVGDVVAEGGRECNAGHGWTGQAAAAQEHVATTKTRARVSFA